MMCFMCDQCKKPVDSWEVRTTSNFGRDQTEAIVRCHGETEIILILQMRNHYNHIYQQSYEELGTDAKPMVSFKGETQGSICL